MAKKKKPRMPGGGNNPMAMMQQLQQLQQKVLEAQKQLETEEVSATAGGGAVTVTITGDQRCSNLVINPEILADIMEEGDVEILQDMIMTAVNKALDDSREMAESRLGPLSSGLGNFGL